MHVCGEIWARLRWHLSIWLDALPHFLKSLRYLAARAMRNRRRQSEATVFLSYSQDLPLMKRGAGFAGWVWKLVFEGCGIIDWRADVERKAPFLFLGFNVVSVSLSRSHGIRLGIAQHLFASASFAAVCICSTYLALRRDKISQ